MRYIICYTVCEARKNPSTAAKGKLGQYLVDEPLERVAIHTLSLLPRTEKGSTYIVIISDYLKRLIVSYSISKQEAITMAGFFVEAFISSYTTIMAGNKSPCYF